MARFPTAHARSPRRGSSVAAHRMAASIASAVLLAACGNTRGGVDVMPSMDAPHGDVGNLVDALDATTTDVAPIIDAAHSDTHVDTGSADASFDSAPSDGGCQPLAPDVAGTRVVAALQGWWGSSGHWSGITYDSADPTVVAAQQTRAEAVGIHGFSVNWYGIGSHTDHTLAAHLSEAAHHTDFKVFAMYDGGALNSVPAGSTNAAYTALAVQQFQYLVSHYTSDPNYLRYGTRPVIQIFSKAGATDRVDWNAVVTAIGGPERFELQIDGSNVVAPFTGGFAWIGPDSVDSAGIWHGSGTVRIDSFYYTMEHSHPTASVMGGAWNWFNDTRASWGTNCATADGGTVRCRVIPPGGGATWCGTFAHNLSHHPQVIQVATWDDYEEGSAIEPGIDFNGILPPAWHP